MSVQDTSPSIPATMSAVLREMGDRVGAVGWRDSGSNLADKSDRVGSGRCHISLLRSRMSTSTPASAPAKAKTPAAEENPELIRFREEWLTELRRRKAEVNSAASSGGATVASGSDEQPPVGTSQSPTGRAFIGTPVAPLASSGSAPKAPVPTRGLPTTHPAVNDGGITTRFHASKSLETALDIYRQAVEHEQRSDLDQALLLYRQAFRLHDNVDRAYHREQMLQLILKDQQELISKKPGSSAPSTEIEDLTKAETITVTGTLATVIQDYTTDLKFEPENENEPVFLNTLPEELVVMIIVERFASVSKKARVLTLDPAIWRRPGLSENQWVNFLTPNFSRIYMQTFLPKWPSFIPPRQRGTRSSTSHTTFKAYAQDEGSLPRPWRLLGSTVHLSHLVDASGRFALPGIDDAPVELPPPPATSGTGARARYVFTMTLNLRSRPLGRWNRMDIHSYDSVNIETGDVYPVALKHERPFWFSKVRSYT
ncbi:hypothetical protein BDZ97DRAFT_2056725 [Flammula alnicola]|nr:hypothetical protein BDZ97DRAFT_2056725 [Flammula alnicola]